MFIIYGAIFYAGASFHRDYGVGIGDMFAAIFSLMYAAFGSGNNN